MLGAAAPAGKNSESDRPGMRIESAIESVQSIIILFPSWPNDLK